MAQASNFLIAANDEHGLNPPTAGKRTPVIPELGRSIYESEFNRPAKQKFILACVRCGYNVFDVKPELMDTSISTRVVRTNRAGATLVVTFAYNAYGDGTNFNNVNGYIIFYSPQNVRPTFSRLLSYDISAGMGEMIDTNNLGVGTLSDVGMLSSVNCPAALVEGGFMTNRTEAGLMLDPDFQREVGEGACLGVSNYLDVPYAEETYSRPTLRRGSRGNDVRYLQYALLYAGEDVRTDGVFGVNTQNAVRSFQSGNGLVVDGIAGRNTWNVLLLNPDARPLLKRGSRGNWVRYAQNKLLSKFYPIGTAFADGIFGSGTESAVKNFQSDMNIAADGIIGPATWRYLSRIGM